jgi:hypothetical protein
MPYRATKARQKQCKAYKQKPKINLVKVVAELGRPDGAKKNGGRQCRANAGARLKSPTRQLVAPGRSPCALSPTVLKNESLFPDSARHTVHAAFVVRRSDVARDTMKSYRLIEFSSSRTHNRSDRSPGYRLCYVTEQDVPRIEQHNNS